MGEHLESQFTIQSDFNEEYILTPEDEKKVLDHSIQRAKDNYHWKLKNEYGFSEMEALSKIAQTDWSKEIDASSILRYANSCKHQDIWQKQRQEEVKRERAEAEKKLMEHWTAERMFSFMKWSASERFKKRLVVNDGNKQLITALCFFLSRDKRFEEQLGYSFEKGLLIRGTVGLGKTFLVQCLERNELNPVLLLSMIDIADQVRLEGEYSIQKGNNRIIYFDDVGSEEATVNHYGTKINYFKDFIEQTYLRNHFKTFNQLMISTNCSFDDIEQKYGMRARSRMKDMFNIVDIKGEDMRGK